MGDQIFTYECKDKHILFENQLSRNTVIYLKRKIFENQIKKGDTVIEKSVVTFLHRNKFNHSQKKKI